MLLTNGLFFFNLLVKSLHAERYHHFWEKTSTRVASVHHLPWKGFRKQANLDPPHKKCQFPPKRHTLKYLFIDRRSTALIIKRVVVVFRLHGLRVWHVRLGLGDTYGRALSFLLDLTLKSTDLVLALQMRWVSSCLELIPAVIHANQLTGSHFCNTQNFKYETEVPLLIGGCGSDVDLTCCVVGTESRFLLPLTLSFCLKCF